MDSFTAQERKTISRLLAKAVRPDDALSIEGLHGFLFGLAIIPELIMPSEWLPVAFGEEMIEFKSEAEAKEMIGFLLKINTRLYNESLEGELRFPFDIKALKKGDIARMGDWAYGLFQAMSLRPEVWGLDDGQESDDVVDELSSACGVIMSVAKPELIPEVFDKPDFDPDVNKKDMELQANLFVMLPGAVSIVQEHAREKIAEYRGGLPQSKSSAVSKREKVGRNEPCPCGSGKKYKKCCGMN